MSIRDLLTGRPLRALSARQRIDWLRLARSRGVGPCLFEQLLQRHGDPAAALDALKQHVRRTGRGAVCSRAAAEEELAVIERLGGRLICRCEGDYPPYLAVIPDPPPVLTVLGDPALLQRPAIAVVGARNASLAGLQQARRMAADLGAADFTVVSGLARGIDGAGHEGGLATGTIAVMAGGIDVIYPREHDHLYAAIAARGAVVCENGPGTPTRPRLFPRRNRIVAGLSLGVLVVEATKRSGSLITARLAGEQGREVFAVPGAPRDPRAQGCNGLLRDGATLAESAEDILAVTGPAAYPENLSQRPPAGGLSPYGRGPGTAPSRIEIPPSAWAAAKRANPPLESAFLDDFPPRYGGGAEPRVGDALSAAPTTADNLMRHDRQPSHAVSEVLLEMELAGRIYRLPGNRVSAA